MPAIALCTWSVVGMFSLAFVWVAVDDDRSCELAVDEGPSPHASTTVNMFGVGFRVTVIFIGNSQSIISKSRFQDKYS